MIVAAGVLAVDLVVAAHNGTGVRALDRDLEGEQVGLAVRVGFDDRVQPVPVGLVAVERVMLERRDDTLALDAVDGLRAEHGAEERILRVVLEIPAVARVTRQVDPARELDIEAPTPRLSADRRTPLAREPRVEARPD